MVNELTNDIPPQQVLLQILPEHMSLCRLFLHTHAIDTSASVCADTSKLSKHARHFSHRLHASNTAPRDENGLLVGEGGWARIPDGYALNVNPEINNVREDGTDVVSRPTALFSEPPHSQLITEA